MYTKKKTGGHGGGRKEEVGFGGNTRYHHDYTNSEPTGIFAMSKIMNATEKIVSEQVVETRHGLGVVGDPFGLFSRDGYLTYDPKNKPTHVTRFTTPTSEHNLKDRPHHTSYPKTAHHSKYNNYSDNNTDEDENDDEDASSDDEHYRHGGRKHNKVGYPRHIGGTKPNKSDDYYSHQEKPKSPHTPPHSYTTLPYYEKPNPYDHEKPTHIGHGYPKLDTYDHEKPTHIGNGYPKLDSYDDKPYPNYHEKTIPRNGYIPSYTVPIVNQSTWGTSSPPTNRLTTGNRFQEYQDKGRNSPPIYSPRDNKGFEPQQATEAWKSKPSGGRGYENDKNKGVIDCKTAAKRYNGVFVPNA